LRWRWKSREKQVRLQVLHPSHTGLEPTLSCAMVISYSEGSPYHDCPWPLLLTLISPSKEQKECCIMVRFTLENILVRVSITSQIQATFFLNIETKTYRKRNSK
jgi:hypothetical protein